MKILVCIKQVPGSSNVEVDPVTGVLKRSGIQSKMNPYDLYAIECALTLAEKYGGTVECITMGPPQAASVIKEAVDFIVGKELMEIGCSENLNRLYDELIGKDWFMTLLDFKDYVEIKEKAFKDYLNREEWARKMLVNISKAGYFSSDRTIEEYNRDIWKLDREE